MSKAPRKPLTHETLVRMLEVCIIWNSSTLDSWDDELMDEWHQLVNDHGVEMISLALAQFIGAKKERRVTYQRKALGPAQVRIVHALGSGPLTVKQIADLTGIHERNLRRNMVSMRARGWLTSDGSLWSIGELPGAKTSE